MRELQRQLDSGLYERLALSRDKESVMRLVSGGQIVESPADAVKDPYVLEFLVLREEASCSEIDLETRIIDHLQEPLLEPGRGYAFVDRRQRFTYEEDHFKVDLVLYNRLLRRFVLFDLRLGTLTHQDIGQMQGSWASRGRTCACWWGSRGGSHREDADGRAGNGDSEPPDGGDRKARGGGFHSWRERGFRYSTW